MAALLKDEESSYYPAYQEMFDDVVAGKIVMFEIWLA